MAKILWFTGLSGSGKTTIAEKLEKYLTSKNKKVLILDGDVIRASVHKHLGFTPEDIKENNNLIIDICLKEKNNFDFILVPIISPFIESRDNARKLLREDFVEIYVDCPLEECIRRDVKGLYKLALNNEIDNFIGISKDNPYQPPKNPDLRIDTFKEIPEQTMKKIISFLQI